MTGSAPVSHIVANRIHVWNYDSNSVGSCAFMYAQYCCLCRLIPALRPTVFVHFDLRMRGPGFFALGIPKMTLREAVTFPIHPG